MLKGKGFHWFFLVLFALVAVYHASRISVHSVNIPFMDEWELLSSTEKLSGFNFDWILAQHNEHRTVPTKIILWTFYKWNQLDFRSVVVFNFLIFIILLLYSINLFNRIDPHRLSLYFFASTFLLSAAMFENHFWGFQSSFHLVLLFSFLTSGVLFQNQTSYRSLALAALLGIFAILSLASGLIMIGAILLIFCFREIIHRQNRSASEVMGRVMIFSVPLVITIFFYFTYRYAKVVDHPNLIMPWTSQFWPYFLNLLSSGWGFSNSSLVPGALILVVMILPLPRVLWTCVRTNASEYWLLLSCLAAIIACLLSIAVGRAGFGIDQAKSSRYVEFSAFLIPLTVALWMRSDLLKEKKARIFAISIFSLVCVSSHALDFDFEKVYRLEAKSRHLGKKCIEAHLSLGDAASCPTVYPWDLTTHLENARKLNLSFYQEWGEKH